MSKHNILALVFTAVVLVFVVINKADTGAGVPVAATEVDSAGSPQEAPDSQEFYAATIASPQSVDIWFDELNISARSLGVFDLKGGEFALRDETKLWPIASITKLMSALIIYDYVPAGAKIKISAVDIVRGEHDYEMFSAGEVFTRDDLLKAMLMRSSNTAAEALANFSADRADFIQLMNSYAVRLGMKSTRFYDPSGISSQNQSNVEDLFKLVMAILTEKPQIFEITGRAAANVTELTTLETREILNIIPFAGRPDFFGGKTGTTPAAVGNLVAVFAESGGGRVIILLGTEDRFREAELILNKW
ncbi:MAG: D-alanyl-D-alanine carboxypeptidase [Candidatus Colwellbacteria bacterium]|nr:D-alanyl-D-alanine carboxypeptidase [Candidatus Colwellbacteria bacterium]